jgi:hypothetical protein
MFLAYFFVYSVSTTYMRHMFGVTTFSVRDVNAQAEVQRTALCSLSGDPDSRTWEDTNLMHEATPSETSGMTADSQSVANGKD